MSTVKKEFRHSNWLVCINMIRKYLDEYNLELISIELKKENDYYVAKIEYGLGVR